MAVLCWVCHVKKSFFFDLLVSFYHLSIIQNKIKKGHEDWKKQRESSKRSFYLNCLLWMIRKMSRCISFLFKMLKVNNKIYCENFDLPSISDQYFKITLKNITVMVLPRLIFVVSFTFEILYRSLILKIYETVAINTIISI